MEYFANLPPDELVREIMARKEAYYSWVMATGRLARWRTAYNTYYGDRGTHTSHHVNAAGEKGELSFLMSNEYRNLVQHLVIMTTQSRPALECGAINSDTASQTQCLLGVGLLEYYMRQAKVERYLKAAAEISLIMDVAWVMPEWDFTLGKDLAVDDKVGRPIRTGDIRVRSRTPLDVALDFTRTDGEENDWLIIRELKNKYDLAAQYPEKAERIKAVGRDWSKDAIFRLGDVIPYGSIESSEIDVYTFVHRKSLALGMGRLMQCLDDGTWLIDGPLPYRNLPAVRICPSEKIMSVMGYANTNDLLGLQDVMDSLISAAVTNMTTCGVNNFWSKPGSNLDFEQLAPGMNFLESEEKPDVIQLAKLAPEWFKLAEFIIGRMEAISGVNSVARGNTQGKDFSGAAMALLQSMAISFNSGLEQSYNQLTEDVGQLIISHLQQFAKSKRTAAIAGATKKFMMKAFTGADIEKIERVFVRQTNPMSKTTSGRMLMAQDFVKMGAIKRPSQYTQVIETGTYEPAIEDDINDELCIKAENEAMAGGTKVNALRTDFHPTHIASHRSLLSDPEARKDVKLLALVDQHIKEHEDLWLGLEPAILAALKMPPCPPPAMPGAPGLPPGAPPAPGGPMGAPGPQAPPAGPPAGAVPMKIGPEAAHSTSAAPAGPGAHMPSQPKNPLSGAKWNPESGGLNQ